MQVTVQQHAKDKDWVEVVISQADGTEVRVGMHKLDLIGAAASVLPGLAR